MVLIYQAYGRDDILAQTFFSVTTLLKHLEPSDDLQIWIYTDRPEQCQRYFRDDAGEGRRIRIVTVTSEQIKRWRGEIDFVHRVKIEILHHASLQFKGSLFYVDGDTYFKKSPMAIFAKVNQHTSLMHVAEGVIADGRDPLSKKLSKFLRKNKFLINGLNVEVSPQMIMWNAGVIGIADSQKVLLPQMLEMTDVLYRLYPKHVQEQLAVSYVLQKNTSVLATDDVIGHYWNQKPEYQIAIDSFLSLHPHVDESLSGLAQFVHPTLEVSRPRAGSAPLLRKIIQTMFSAR